MSSAYREHLTAGQRAGSRYALAAPRRAGATQAGVRMGRQAGRSIDFRDFREYEPGDDLRWLDWGAYARSDRLVVKLYHEEVSHHLDLVIDGSRSMALDGSAKAACTLGLAAALAVAAANARCSHRVMLAGDRVAAVERGQELPELWEAIELGGVRPLGEAFGLQPLEFRRLSTRVLLSDLLWPGEPLPVLWRLADGAATVAVVQVLARDDLEPPELGNMRLEDVETGARLELFVDAPAAQRYRQALAHHQQHWQRACRAVGATLTTVTAEDLVADWDLGALERAGILEARG